MNDPFWSLFINQSSQSFSKTQIPATWTASLASQEDFAQQVEAFRDQWIINLRRKLSPFDLGKFSVINSPFEEGVKVLQKCFKGILPSTLVETFSLLLIASVAVNEVWHSMNSKFQATFFDNVLEWHCTIPNLQEKQVFFRAIDCLLCLQPNYLHWHAHRVHSTSRDLNHQVDLSGDSAALTSHLDRSMPRGVLHEQKTSLALPKGRSISHSCKR